jgi:alcohol dehydrogenase
MPPPSSTHAAWSVPRAGSIARLALRREPLPEPGPGEVRVAVRAVGLNFADVFALLGLYSATPRGAFVPGLECAGVVDAAGPGLPGRPSPAPGARVMAITRFGGYATHVVVDARQVHPVPEGWDLAQAAAFPVQAITAWYALLALGEAERGEVVLVHSAAGGVGLHALAIARALGLVPIATVGAAAKAEHLVRSHGLPPAAVVVRDRRRFPRQLDRALAAVGADGLDLVLDAVMGPFFAPALARLRPEGRHLVFGAADFMAPADRPAPLRLATRWLARPRVDPLALVDTNRAVMGFNLIWLWDRLERLPRAYADLGRLGLLGPPPHVGARLPFDRAPEAVRLLQSGQTTGKVVLEVEGGVGEGAAA